MRDDEGFDILHNGVPRTFRDQKAMAYEAARFAKTQNPADLIELVDRREWNKVSDARERSDRLAEKNWPPKGGTLNGGQP